LDMDIFRIIILLFVAKEIKMAKLIKAKDQLLVAKSLVLSNPKCLACLGVGYLWPC
jgi:hypothetical protein